MDDDPVKQLRSDIAVLLDNVTCWYCARRFDDPGVVRTTEHVIARRFVPRGKLNRQWNLIGGACEECNRRKANLEDDLSAISMQANAYGKHADGDHALKAEATRKGKNSFSRRTKKPVVESGEKISITASLAPCAEWQFELTAAPQADSVRVYELARLQLMVFFYRLTFDQSTRRGGFWRGGFFPVYDTVRSDWGNVLMRAFMDVVVEWEPRLLASGADGFFSVAIRKHPGADCWSWALEWNKNYRVIGFFGDRAAAEPIVKGFPQLKLQSIAEGPDGFVRFHRETPLPESEDKLFYWENPAAPETGAEKAGERARWKSLSRGS